MPDFYALTSPKLYAIIHRVLLDENTSAHVLSDLYKYIWTLRHDQTVKPTMNTLVLLAQRFALDRKLTGRTITRIGPSKPKTPMMKSYISDTELDLLSQICSNLHSDQGKPCYAPLTKDAVHARLGTLVTNESQS
jgi:hypothetical protein